MVPGIGYRARSPDVVDDAAHFAPGPHFPCGEECSLSRGVGLLPETLQTKPMLLEHLQGSFLRRNGINFAAYVDDHDTRISGFLGCPNLWLRYRVAV